MATTIQPKQFPSAAKWVFGALFQLLLISVTVSAELPPVVSPTPDLTTDFEKSDSVGGKGGGNFSVQLDGNLLIGLNAWQGTYGGHRVIQGIQPVFLTSEGVRLGKINGKAVGEPLSVKAKDGYSVGGLVANGGHRVDGFKIIFMKKTPTGLDANDMYESEWVGGEWIGAKRLGGSGVAIIGIYGTAGAGLDRLGLLQKNKFTPSVSDRIPASLSTPLQTSGTAVPSSPPAAKTSGTVVTLPGSHESKSLPPGVNGNSPLKEVPPPFDNTFVGNWIIDFGNGEERAYQISSDGSFLIRDKHRTTKGIINREAGDFVSHLPDRVQRFTKLSATTLKVESFDPKILYSTNSPSSVWTATLEIKKAPTHPIAAGSTTDGKGKTAGGDNGELQRALTEFGWVITKSPGNEAVPLRFTSVGYVDCKHLRGGWSIIGVREVCVHELPKMNELILRFSEGLDSFSIIGDSRTGKRNAPRLTAKRGAAATTPRAEVGTGTEPASPPLAAGTSKTLVLGAKWDTPLQGGSQTMDDLSKLFGSVTSAKVNLSGDNNIPVYQNIPYLTPIREVIERLKLTERLPSKVMVACPGLPSNSFFYYAIDGRFDGSFTRIYLVVDRADQFVCAQLVNEAPKGDVSVSTRDAGWHTYNFINARSKALSTLRIEHKLALGINDTWVTSAKSGAWTVIRVDSKLVQTDNGRRANARLLEEVRWYVPRPLVELILTCVQKAPR